ncbi:MAG: CpaF family protein [Anaerolineae bacterium]|nr:CpaF family protein [Anaerolineae bacterium]
MPAPSLKRIGETPSPEKTAAPGPTPTPAGAPKIGLPLEPDDPTAPPQRGSISRQRAEQLRLQLWLADKLRQSIAPEQPLDVPLERTPEREQLVQQRYQQAKQRANITIPPGVSEQTFFNNILDEIFGFGPLEVLFREDSISEVMVNGPYIIYIEQKGKISESGLKFLDDDHVERIIKRIVKPLGRVVDENFPLVDARLPDGSRVNAVIRPCAIDGPSITVRKFSKERLTIENLINFGSITPDMAEFLRACVVSRLNIVVSGGTGSGKTTLLNILSSFIPEDERIVTIEDAAELQLQQRHVVRLETKKSTPVNPNEISIRDLVVNSLRMRPERVVIGECRSGEALDMLQAMNTGHDGSLTTIHANSPRDCISRLETLVLMAGVDLPLQVVRRQIASAVHLIVQASRLRDGSRKVVYITEIQGIEGDTVVLQDIFKFIEQGEQEGKVVGEMEAGGLRPKCEPKLKQHGFNLPASMFMKGGA